MSLFGGAFSALGSIGAAEIGASASKSASGKLLTFEKQQSYASSRTSQSLLILTVIAVGVFSFVFFVGKEAKL